MNSIVYCAAPGKARELLQAAALVGDATAIVLNDKTAAEEIAAAGSNVLNYQVDASMAADTAAMAEIVVAAAGQIGADVVFLLSDKRGKELAGRVAAKLQAGCLTDVTAAVVEDGQLVCSRNMTGGATVAKQTILSGKKVIAIAPKAFAPKEDAAAGAITEVAFAPTPSVVYQGFVPRQEDSVDISKAEILFAIGQGVDDESAVEVMESVAASMKGAALGCTKPVATDRKWLPESRIIGLSGSVCKPELAILLGISGQSQFAVGIRDAKTIVSVNTDEEADVARMSDFFMNGDANEVISSLKECFA